MTRWKEQSRSLLVVAITSKPPPLSISSGVCSSPKSFASVRGFMRRILATLYSCKQNRVTLSFTPDKFLVQAKDFLLCLTDMLVRSLPNCPNSEFERDLSTVPIGSDAIFLN